MKYTIVAYDKNRVIGANNSLLWMGEMAADMKRFREKTTGNAVIMGRKTYESIGRPLPNRQNIVITRSDLKIDGVDVAHSLEDAYKEAQSGKDIYVIGGGQIFEQSLNDVDEILATEINAEFQGDVYFPSLNEQWYELGRENHQKDDKNKYDYSFVSYIKRR